MKQLAITVNFTKPGAARLAREICERLAQAGLEPLVFEEDAASLPAPARALPKEECLRRCGALLSIGGDGTILTAVRMALPYQKPVLGVNAGRLGYLAGLENHELSLLPRLASGHYHLDRRMLLEIQVWQGGRLLREDLCLNDAVLSRHFVSHLVEVPVDCGGHVLTYHGDGVIFSTPTGSTAYSFSAGGPVLEPGMDSILLTPICNHLLFSRAIVFSSQARFSVDIPQEGLALTCDAEPPFALLPGQRVTLRRAGQEATLIRLKQDGFLDVLSRKMRQ
jgi:NAD+ kinase